MIPDTINQNILKTLLYYDIFKHPLKKDEIFTFSPKNNVTRSEIFKVIDDLSGNDIREPLEERGIFGKDVEDCPLCCSHNKAFPVCEGNHGHGQFIEEQLEQRKRP